MPEEHITKDKKADAEDFSLYFAVFIVLVIVMIVIVFYMMISIRRGKRKDSEKAKEEKTYIGMPLATAPGQKGKDKYQPPTVVCHVCGKSLKVMTLNRPVVVTCTDCGHRGAVYK